MMAQIIRDNLEESGLNIKLLKIIPDNPDAAAMIQCLDYLANILR
jgi:hypothetical protein